MRLIAHLSDLHFGREDATALAALGRDLAAVRPDLVVVSGDLTQRARDAQFAAAHAFLMGLGLPLVVVPGNHDLPLFPFWKRMTGPFERYRRHFGNERLPAYLDGELAVVGVVTPHASLWKRGRLAAPQLARIAERFAATPAGRLRVVVAHHPIVTGEDPQGERARGAAEALAALRACAVDVVLAGHHHRSWSGGDAGTARGAGGTRSVVMVHAGTAVSDRRRHEANSYNLLCSDGPRLEVTIRSMRGDSFTAGAANIFLRRGDGWTTLL